MLEVNVKMKKNSKCFLKDMEEFKTEDEAVIIQNMDTWVILDGVITITTNYIHILHNDNDFYFKIEDISNVFVFDKETAVLFAKRCRKEGEHVECVGDT